MSTQQIIEGWENGAEPYALRYKVNTGYRRNRYFKTEDAARRYCGEVFARSNVVLGIVAETKSISGA